MNIFSFLFEYLMILCEILFLFRITKFTFLSHDSIATMDHTPNQCNVINKGHWKNIHLCKIHDPFIPLTKCIYHQCLRIINYPAGKILIWFVHVFILITIVQYHVWKLTEFSIPCNAPCCASSSAVTSPWI